MDVPSPDSTRIPTQLPGWQQLLAQRGILAAALTLGWQPHVYKGQPGWAYSVFDLHGRVIGRRWKNQDSEGTPKYAWLPSKPDECLYYLPPGFRCAVAKAGGVAYLASGEPDLLAYLSAGIRNVFCWFGEGSIPRTLAADLAGWGVREIRGYPDRDTAGRGSAQKIVNLLHGTGVAVHVYELPDSLGEKGDINKLWVALGHDAERFHATLAALPLLPLQILPQRERMPKRSAQPSHAAIGDFPKTFYEAIERALGVERFKSNGWSHPVHCPFHDDDHPSAGWHHDKHILKCFPCEGDGTPFYLAMDVASKLGIDWRRYVEPHPSRSRPARPVQEPEGFTPLDPISLDQITHVKYVTELKVEPFLGRVTALQALTGEGKTALGEKIWAEIAARNPHARVLIISRNSQIVRILASRFGAECYLDVERGTEAQCQQLAICVNSLPKLQQNGTLATFDFLFIDESEAVLTALGDKTFQRSQPTRTFRVLRQLIQQTPTVLLADAHLSALTIDLARRLRPDTVYVKNSFPQERRPGTRYQSMNDITDELRAAVAESDGVPVFAMWGSKTKARAETDILRRQYGEEQILLVTQDTTSDARVQAFLDNPTEEAAKYRAILGTSVIGNGIDIQAECNDVFVIQADGNLDGLTIAQIAGRVRHAKALHIYQPQTTPCRETSWKVISRNALSRAEKTRQRVLPVGLTGDWTDARLLAPDEDDLQLLGLTSYAKAQRNHSLNALQSHTDYLLSPHWNIISLPLPATKAFPSSEVRERNVQAASNADRFEALICEVAPVDDKTFIRLRRGRQVTDEVMAGFFRWQAEQIFRRPITKELARAFLKDEVGPTYFFRLYLNNGVSAAMIQDFREIVERHALSKRHHLTRQLEIVRLGFSEIFGQTEPDPEIEVEKAELEKRVQGLLDVHGDEICTLFDWRRPIPDAATCVVTRLLKVMGLGKLRRRPLKRQEKTYYSIDPEALEHRRMVADAMERPYEEDPGSERQEVGTPELLPTRASSEEPSPSPARVYDLVRRLPDVPSLRSQSRIPTASPSEGEVLSYLPPSQEEITWAVTARPAGAHTQKRGPPQSA